MTLDKASRFYSGSSRHYNPLWRYIYEPFMASLERCPNMYVAERISSDGVAEHDVHAHIADDKRTPLVITGPAGIGKTTFLEQAVRDQQQSRDCAIIWIDVLRIADQDAEDRYRRVEGTIGKRLEELVTHERHEFTSWWQFLLAHWSDAKGRSSVLLHRIRSGTPLEDRELASDLMSLLEEMTFLESARMRLAYIRATFGKRPVIVVDNTDRLPLALQSRVLKLALALGSGSVADSNEVVPRPLDDHAVIIAAMRPETLSQVNPQQSVGLVDVGELKPPVIRLVLQRRLKDFFDHWDQRVIKNPRFKDSHGRFADLREILGELGLFQDTNLDEFARDLVLALAESLTSDSGPERLSDLIHKATNYNTRRSLLGLTQYVASGHHDWAEIAKAIQDRHPLAAIPSWHKRLRALLLGTRALYSTKDSWVINLFSDVPRGSPFVTDEAPEAADDGLLGSVRTRSSIKPDGVGALIQIWILRFFQNQGTARLGELGDLLARLFRYDPERTEDTALDLAGSGLIQETAHQHFSLSPAGVTYLRQILSDFEYLQHVVIDTFVDPEFIVPCRKLGEPATMRFERVLRFAEWVYSLELADLAEVVRSNSEAEYRRCFGRDTTCEMLAKTLQHVLRGLPGSADWGATLEPQLQALLKRSHYPALRTQAQVMAGVES